MSRFFQDSLEVNIVYLPIFETCISPVNRYRESALKAASHTQRCESCRSSRSSVQSLVFQIFAEQSPEVVTSILSEIQNLCKEVL